MVDPLAWIAGELDALQRQDLLRRRRTVQPLPDGWCLVDGRRLRNYAANDYLGLAFHPRVIEAAESALHDSGAGARASALVTGRTPWHARLEEHLARFEGAEAALLFPTGYAANVGTTAALVGAGDFVYCDRLNHAGLIDGCRLSGAKLRVYPHGDVDRLRSLLAKDKGARRLIVTDSLFSMDGDAASLSDLCELAESAGAMLLVDEAHATGVFGRHGRGLVEAAGIESQSIIRVGTLSKAVGVQGGFVTGSQALIDWLWNQARPQMFSTALTPASCAAACAAISIIEQEPDRRQRLLERAAAFRDHLTSDGLRLPPGCCGPIVPVILGDPARALDAAAGLEERGFLAAAIRPPTVPRGTSRLRMTLSASHDAAADRELASAVREVLR